MADVRTMSCIEIAGTGGPEVLKPATRPVPVAGPGEVLIRVAAAGVNRPDIFQRMGMYPPPEGASDLPGLEVAGTIEETGDGASKWKVGDEVCALLSGGGYAEYCTAPEVQCLPIPGNLNMVQAASLPETFFTVWTNVFERGALKSGQTLLVHGGSSGIGVTAIQMARCFGANVAATAGSNEKCAACEKLGAGLAINYRETDFVGAVREFTGGRGADVILDMVGGDYVDRNIQALAADGRLVSIAFLKGPKAEVNLMPLMLKRLTITGSTLRHRPVEKKGEIAEALEKHVWPLIEKGQIKPVIDSTYPLSEASEGHRRMESSRHIGKIVLTV